MNTKNKILKPKYKVWCNSPYGGGSHVLAVFLSIDDAKSFAKKEAEKYSERFYCNKGTFITKGRKKNRLESFENTRY